jgi:hypothetical protein
MSTWSQAKQYPEITFPEKQMVEFQWPVLPKSSTSIQKLEEIIGKDCRKRDRGLYTSAQVVEQPM